MLPAMEAIAQPLVARLSATLQSPESSNPNEVAACLEQLCALLRSVTPPSAGAAQDPQLAANGGHPCVQMLDKLWDTFAAVFARHGTSSNCMEKLCRCYKHTARNCGDWFRPLVLKLIPQVPSRSTPALHLPARPTPFPPPAPLAGLPVVYAAPALVLSLHVQRLPHLLRPVRHKHIPTRAQATSKGP